MTRYLLDTNHLGEMVRPASVPRDRVAARLRLGDDFGTCGPALCEPEKGIQKRSDIEACRRRLATMLTRVKVWPTDLETARRYGELANDLERSGRALSQTDTILAALALQMNAVLLTADRDFDPCPACGSRTGWPRPASAGPARNAVSPPPSPSPAPRPASARRPAPR